ncbi:rho GTPase-activating protein 18 [Caerostris darwini]|uniref:Rho GTPase-activating protein 18 n=1 Tax=Caerostris darwini TaxID=1538125 RepID=A0AAV4VFA5_9ARAC|nr:rho GTPase-activating protein 18 [Caerostris darwini]
MTDVSFHAKLDILAKLSSLNTPFHVLILFVSNTPYQTGFFKQRQLRDPSADVLPAPPQQHRGCSDKTTAGEVVERVAEALDQMVDPRHQTFASPEQTTSEPIVMRHRCLMGTKKTGDTLKDHYLYFIRENVGESSFPENPVLQENQLLLFKQGAKCGGVGGQRSLREKFIALEEKTPMPKGIDSVPNLLDPPLPPFSLKQLPLQSPRGSAKSFALAFW